MAASLSSKPRLLLKSSIRACSNLATSHECVLAQKHGKVGVATLNRPESLNALSDQLWRDLHKVMQGFQKDPGIGCIVITGSEKVFAAGADIKEMSDLTFSNVYEKRTGSYRNCVMDCPKPVIAAVNGFALGGGCELAMCCDIIYAGDAAQFGQPEINLAIIPGSGGTQRLIQAVGKSKAMEMCLSGRRIGAEEAKQYGLVSKVFPAASVLQEAMKTADVIASKSTVVTQMCKEATNVSFDTTLQEGLRFEKIIAASAFATDDHREGVAAFVEKRKPVFTGR